MWDLIVSVPDHCLSFYFLLELLERKTLKQFHERDGSTNKQTNEQTNEHTNGKTKTIYPSA